MTKNIVNWFAVLVFAGVLSACGQNQGTDQGAAGSSEKPAGAPAAPAGGEKPAEPTGK